MYVRTKTAVKIWMYRWWISLLEVTVTAYGDEFVYAEETQLEVKCNQMGVVVGV